MDKDFGHWHSIKNKLHMQSLAPYFYEREIWWAAIGCNVGSEEDGKGPKYARPVLILRKFNRNFFYGLPFSSSVKSGIYYHPVIIGNRPSIALLSHLRDYDARRLLDKIGVIDRPEFVQIQNKLSAIITAPTR